MVLQLPHLEQERGSAGEGMLGVLGTGQTGLLSDVDAAAGWAHIVEFTACTAARIGETSGVRRADISRETWTWNVRRQTTPGPGGLIDKGTKGKRVRVVPIIPEIRSLVDRRLNSSSDDPMGRVFTGPRGGPITTAVLRDATHWDEVVTALGYG